MHENLWQKKQLTSTTIARTTIFESRSDNLRESYGRTPHKQSTSLFQSLDYIGSHFRKKAFVKLPNSVIYMQG